MLSKSYPLPKIIFLDIDDTLYIKDEERIPQSVKPALLALKNQGVLLVKNYSIFHCNISKLKRY